MALAHRPRGAERTRTAVIGNPAICGGFVGLSSARGSDRGGELLGWSPSSTTKRTVSASLADSVSAMPRDAPTTVVFDLGGVLIDWDPRYLYRKLFDDPDEMDRSLPR